MKRHIAAIGSVMFIAALALGAFAQDAAPAKPAAKPAKAAKATEPKSDADVQKCLADKFAASKTIKNGAAAVSGGEATLTGEAISGQAKSGAIRSAKACGATKVVNNITVAPKPAKPAERKS
jgi:osmotically-inducible protein OsmY